MDHEILETRVNTQFVLVHFTGEDSSTYESIKQSHVDEGEAEIGFHFVITTEGTTLMGRHISKVGFHNSELNETSVGICVIGFREDMSDEQSIALTLLLEKIKSDYPFLNTIKYLYRTH